jgi:tetratricopeptide (TPR) repeat protein/mono/diheme cytochrome c family protein
VRGPLPTAVALATVGLLLLIACFGCSPTSDEATVTFNRDVAPIVFRNCVACHRPGESAPFSFLSYSETKKRAGLIAALTGSRFMPPWQPERGTVEFQGERGLSDEEIELIRVWVEQGAVEGDAADLPAPPEFAEGWKLGEPDVVLTLQEPFMLPAEGVDVFRNFVLSIPVSTPRWVKALELRPGNPRIVHHGLMQVDRSRSSRRRDEEDLEAGFPGMDMAGSEAPGGLMLGWTPGKSPVVDERLAWLAEPGSDMVVQLHMLPSGKPEPVAPKVGLYFTDEAPRERAFSLLMRNDEIDIPAGAAGYVVEDSLTLPVAVEVLGIYPHAHYLATSVEATATLPDGGDRLLIRVPNWDFNWQDEYRYKRPLQLPAGSVIHMRYVYDNTSANVRNPNDPPERVRFGNRSSDEMATLTLQVVPEQAADAHRLREAVMRGRLERDPDSWFARSGLSTALNAQGRMDEALPHIRQAIRLRPRHPELHYNLANTLMALGRSGRAIKAYERALALEPDHPKAHNNLAVALQQRGELERAVHHYREQLAASPMDALPRANLGAALLEQGRLEAADQEFRHALKLDPNSITALEGRGDLARARGQLEQAERRYRQALTVEPGAPGAHYGLGAIRLAQGAREPAIGHFRRAVKSDRTYIGVLNEDAWRLATHPDPALRAPEQALVLSTLANELTGHERPRLLATLAAAQAANGEFDRAVQTLERALALADDTSAARYIPEFRERLALYRRGMASGDDAAP